MLFIKVTLKTILGFFDVVKRLIFQVTPITTENNDRRSNSNLRKAATDWFKVFLNYL